jgi:hypothetical protein
MRIIKLFVLTLAVLLMLCGSSLALLDTDGDGRVDWDKIEEVDPRVDTHESTFTHITDAPADGKLYFRKDGAWQQATIAARVAADLADAPQTFYGVAGYSASGSCVAGVDTPDTLSQNSLTVYSSAVTAAGGNPEINVKWICMEATADVAMNGGPAYVSSYGISGDMTITAQAGLVTFDGEPAYVAIYGESGDVVLTGLVTFDGSSAFVASYGASGDLTITAPLAFDGEAAYVASYGVSGDVTVAGGAASYLPLSEDFTSLDDWYLSNFATNGIGGSSSIEGGYATKLPSSLNPFLLPRDIQGSVSVEFGSTAIVTAQIAIGGTVSLGKATEGYLFQIQNYYDEDLDDFITEIAIFKMVNTSTVTLLGTAYDWTPLMPVTFNFQILSNGDISFGWNGGPTVTTTDATYSEFSSFTLAGSPTLYDNLTVGQLP